MLAQVPGTSRTGSNASYPQIVRVSYIDGDVRVARGKEAAKLTKTAWEVAAVDLPVASGYSLVTGAGGRAEVEFEDTSVIYLGENSVLQFDNVSSTGGVPYTELNLLSGMMTVDVRPMAAGELFRVGTPTGRVTMHYPETTFMRVNSYLDAMAVTAMADTTILTGSKSPVKVVTGSTVTMRGGMRMSPEKPVDQTSYASWDAWVGEQVKTRDAALAATMKDAGLSAPIPGLTELAEQGTFSDCAPYGRCWEPKDGWAAGQTPEQPAEVVRQTVSVRALQQGGVVQAGQSVGGQPNLPYVDDGYFPCSPFRWRNYMQRDPITGQMTVVRRTLLPGFGRSQYDWAVCHAGTWIHRRRHYVWVVGIKRHPHPPLHWVQVGKTKGYVPIHPLDKAGETPLNLKNGLYHATDKKGDSVEHIAYAENTPVKVLTEEPKQFRNATATPMPLARAEAPRVEARALLATRGSETRPMMAAISFDRKSQGFVVAGQGGRDGRTVVQPIGSRGTSEAARGGESTHAGGGAGGVSRAAASSSGGGGGGSASHASAPAASSSSSSNSGKH